ncbi:uncharacterized protein LOC123507203 [Portunus trituberculatus]|uniref:uncharacterized protein LOC123507203 n=1 Tax=Portunus trituberculatus TaxID=210409 RepID=UPI001E1D0916|nr:uncharacterized protein LOC123507203 [Portunus trituberculatus]
MLECTRFSQLNTTMATRDLKGTPLSYAQKLYLVRQIRDHPVVHTKPSNYTSILERKAAWETITKNFNVCFSTAEPKNTHQLKKTWEYLKNKVKKDHSRYIRETHQTGGGPPPAPPKPADEVTLIVQLILNNRLPVPDDIFDSEFVEACVLARLNSTALECADTPEAAGQQPAQDLVLDNPGSPLIIRSEDCELIDAEDDVDLPGARTSAHPVLKKGTCSARSSSATAATQNQSFTGRKRKAAESKSAAYGRCAKQQKHFRDELASTFEALAAKVATTLDSVASAADKIGSAADRMASAAERIAAALERVAGIHQPLP